MTIECSRSVHSIALGILPSLLPLSFAGQSLVPANAFTKLFSSDPCFIHAQIFNTLAIAPRISDMNPAVFSLNQAGIFVTAVVDVVPRTDKALAVLDNTPPGLGFSSVLGNGEYDRTALVGPDGALGLVIEGDVIVYNADCAALKTDCGNACVVVAQHSRLRHAPGLAVIMGFRTVNMVSRAAAQQADQISGRKLHDIAVYAPAAAGHHDAAPGFALVI